MAEQNWTRITEALPDAELAVLMFEPGADDQVWPGYFDGERWFYLGSNRPTTFEVTHWREFPEPPAEGLAG
jgi:hypothetical protein